MAYTSSSLTPIMDNRGVGDAQRTNWGRAAGLFLGLILTSVVFAGLVSEGPGEYPPVPGGGPEGLNGLYGVGVPSQGATRGASETEASSAVEVPSESERAAAEIPDTDLQAPLVPVPRAPSIPRPPRESLSVSLPAALSVDSVVRVEFLPGGTLSWSLPSTIRWEAEDGSSVAAAPLRPSPRLETREGARYADAYAGLLVDVEYVSTPRSLKEDFVLTARPASSPGSPWLTFAFSLSVPETLTARAGNLTVTDRPITTPLAVDFLQDGATLFSVTQPFAYEREDASQRVGAEYRVARVAGRLDLAVRVPAEWLLDPARRYPVVVD